MTHQPHSRRDFLRTLGAGAVAASPLAAACRSLGTAGGASAAPSTASAGAGATGWDLVPGILARIRPPVFPDRDFAVTSYGAVGDGRTDCTGAFRGAIAACTAAGGGRVVVPEGRFLTGAIHLRSNVDLHVVRDATIVFSTDPAKYLPAVRTWFEGMELMNYSPLVYAYRQENIAVTGEGTLDGQAGPEHWWAWKGGNRAWGWKPGDPDQRAARARLYAMMQRNEPVERRVFGEGDYLRPSFIEPHSCRNVLIGGITIVNSPMWELHPALSTNVTVRGVKINSLGPNNDGCDPEGCHDVLIENTTFNTGDDCIAIKSGRNEDGRRLATPSENIVVRGCHMLDGHGGVTIGSEISGGVRNVFVERCDMDSPHLDRALRFKNNAARGGLLEHVYMRDVTIGQVTEAVLAIDFYYEEGPKGAYVPVVRDVELRRVTSRKSRYALFVRSFEKAEIADLRLVDCTFDGVAEGSVVKQARRVTLENVRVNGRLVNDVAAL